MTLWAKNTLSVYQPCRVLFMDSGNGILVQLLHQYQKYDDNDGNNNNNDNNNYY